MEFDELLITTGVDALVRLVKERQRVEIEDASSILNIPNETLEDWARVLEEENILRIEYRLTKIYLLWVKPTEEEIATERASFYEEKKDISAEVEKVRQRIAEESGDLEGLRRSFAEFYSKVYSRMDSLEKAAGQVPAAKTITEDVSSKYEAELGEMGNTLGETRNALEKMRREVEELGISEKGSPSQQLMADVERMHGELAALQAEMAEVRKKAASEGAHSDVSLPAVKDLKKKFEALQKDFAALRSRNAQMREDMVSLHESSEILKSVAESIMGQEDKIGALRAETEGLTKEAEALLAKTNEVVSKARQNAELIERLGDSVDVAKAVLKKFPDQGKVMEGLDTLKAEEDKLAEKTEVVEKLLGAVGGRQVTAKQFAEIIKRMDQKSSQIRKDMDSLEAALQDEKTTYLTFQKIKERIVPAIDGYQQQLQTMEDRIAKIGDESAAQMRSMKEDAKKLQESFKGGQMQDVLKVAEEIRGKKKSLEEIRAGLEDLVSMSDNLNKRVTLLSREAKLLEIRTGGAAAAGGPGVEAEEKAVRQKLELTQQEEMEFRRKREELKKLIQRLWEE